MTRYLEILKLRGSDFVSGRHTFKISRDGITLFPRRLISVGEGVALGDRRVTTGVNQLDALLNGGLRERSVTAVTGSAGSGKTLLGLQYVCEGAREHGEPGLYYSVEEPATQIESLAASFG